MIYQPNVVFGNQTKSWISFVGAAGLPFDVHLRAILAEKLLSISTLLGLPSRLGSCIHVQYLSSAAPVVNPFGLCKSPR